MELTSYAELAVELVNEGGHEELGAVFDAAEKGAEEDVVARLNALLAHSPMRPHISGHDGERWHLHLSDDHDKLAKAVMGLAVLVTMLGPDRLGRCQAAPCRNAFIDATTNRSRRYCSERCASRANVAAYRARRKVAR
ncbi:CGNR zinc finger domain-containing protein [Thermoactinospora rubra]|uniref:CGNR zinc finger domain-containing protein n=1 Tax=Thermoactinospora rubra TaxID=1088767 RepID=UPI000A11FB82|nr:CGNR zinc finger domain-containing protein [Thermoactinospora rubra]